ncbi:MAG: hypothetical protein MAG715_00147 [Methanonatronarchaeales archaeon]|nr:hypothetical protein [Methanonatronarchaeales archaeon]
MREGDTGVPSKSILLFLLLALTVTIGGCAGTEAVVPEPLGGEEVELPGQVVENVKRDVSRNASVTAYSTNASIDELGSAYGEQLEENGWEKVRKAGSMTVWRSGERGLGVALFSTEQLPKEQLGLPESSRTLAVLVEGELDTWNGYLVRISGRAFLDGEGGVVFVPSDLYPSSIPQGEYEYTVRGTRNGSQVTVKGPTPGESTLRNGTRAVFQAEEASANDVLVIKYGGSAYPVQILASEDSGTMHAPAHP